MKTRPVMVQFSVYDNDLCDGCGKKNSEPWAYHIPTDQEMFTANKLCAECQEKVSRFVVTELWKADFGWMKMIVKPQGADHGADSTHTR